MKKPVPDPNACFLTFVPPSLTTRSPTPKMNKVASSKNDASFALLMGVEPAIEPETAEVLLVDGVEVAGAA